jgi:hypothetical protein
MGVIAGRQTITHHNGVLTCDVAVRQFALHRCAVDRSCIWMRSPIKDLATAGSNSPHASDVTPTTAPHRRLEVHAEQHDQPGVGP